MRPVYTTNNFYLFPSQTFIKTKFVWVKCVSVSSDSFHSQVFREAVKAAVAYKQNTTDFLDQVMQELEVKAV